MTIKLSGIYFIATEMAKMHRRKWTGQEAQGYGRRSGEISRSPGMMTPVVLNPNERFCAMGSVFAHGRNRLSMIRYRHHENERVTRCTAHSVHAQDQTRSLWNHSTFEIVEVPKFQSADCILIIWAIFCEMENRDLWGRSRRSSIACKAATDRAGGISVGTNTRRYGAESMIVIDDDWTIVMVADRKEKSKAQRRSFTSFADRQSRIQNTRMREKACSNSDEGGLITWAISKKHILLGKKSEHRKFLQFPMGIVIEIPRH
jgi:hypothetical protein